MRIKLHKIRKIRLRQRTWVSVGIILLLVPIVLVSILRPGGAEAGWFDDSYSFRQKVSFTHNADVTSARRINVTVNTSALISAGKMQTDCDDVRFTDSQGQILRYQLTSGCNTTTTEFDVVYNSVVNGTNFGYVYYGNKAAGSRSEDVSAVTGLTPSGGAESVGTEEKGPSPVAYWKMDEGLNNTCHLAPGANQSPVSVVHNGTVSLATNQSSNTATITSVDTTKSFLTFTVNQNDEVSPECGEVSGELTNSTTITFRRESGACTNTVNLEYYVTEFSSGVSVQRGVASVGAATLSDPITNIEIPTPVDTTKAFPIISSQGGFAAWGWDDFHEAEITSSDNLQIRLEDSNSRTSVYWQVVEFQSASVQHGTVQMGSGATSQTDDIATPVDTDKTWLLFSYRSGNATGDMDQDLVRGVLTDTDTVTFDRNTSGVAVNITWYAVEFTNNTNVYHGSEDFGTTDTTQNVTITAIDTDRTIATAGAFGYSGGKTSYTADDNIGPATVTMNFTTTTNLQLVRGDHESATADIGWFVIEFDDTAAVGGNDYCDSSQNGRAGENNNVTWRSPEFCVTGNCSYFNGTSSYVNIADSGSSDLYDMANLTVSLWVRPNGTQNANANIIDKGHEDTTDTGWAIEYNAGGTAIYFTAGNGTTSVQTSDVTIDADRWSHVTATFDGSNLRLYVNGELKNTTSLSGSLGTNDTHLGIGRWQNTPGRYFQGFVDDVKVFHYARSASDIKADYLSRGSNVGTGASLGYRNQKFLSDGLVGYWKMDGTSGNPIDSSGNSLTLTNNNTVTFVPGKFGNGSEHVPASSQYFSTATTVPGVKTVSFWVNPDSTTNHYANLTSSAYINSSSGTISATGFTSPTIYVNGVQSSSIAADSWQLVVVTTNTAINADTVYLGRANADYLDGTLDDVRFFNRQLTSEEVFMLYQLGRDPLTYWNFDENEGEDIFDRSTNTKSGMIDSLPAASVTHVDTVTGNNVGVANTLSVTSGTVTSDSSHFYIAAVGGGSASNISVTSVSGLGLTWSQIDYQCVDNNAFFTSVWYGAGTPTGDGTVTANLSASAAIEGAEILVSRYSGVNLASPIGNSSSANENGVNGSCSEVLSDTSTPSVSVNSSIGNLVYAASQSRQRTFNSWDNSFTQRGTDTASSAGNISRVSVADVIASGSSTTASGTLSGVTDWSIIAVEINSSSSGGVSGWYPGRYGSSWSFDGITDQMEVADDPLLDFEAGNSFTISTWFTHDTISTDPDYLISKFESTGADGGYQIYMENDGDITCGIDDENTSFPEDSVTSTAATYDDNKWHHVACVKLENSALQLFIDGALVASDASISATGTLANDDNFIVATDSAGANLWTGKIDEMRIYNFAQTQGQIVEDMNATHPIGGSPLGTQTAYWKLDENNGTTANDTANNNIDLTLVNTPAWTESGKLNNALDLEASSSQYGYAADSAALSITGSVSIAAWIKAESSQPNTAYNIAGKWDGTNESYLLQQYAETIRFYVDSSSNYVSTTGSHIVGAVNWYHVVGVYDASTATVKIYINGQPVATTTTGTIPSSIGDDAGRFHIGAEDSTTTAANFFDGIVDDVQVYATALNQSQVNLIMNANAASNFGTGSVESAQVEGGSITPPIGEWKLDDNTGSAAVDSSGSGNNGTLSGNTTWAPGKYGQAARFDGSGDNISAGNPSILQFERTDDFTLSAWFRTTIDGGQTIVGKQDNNTSDRGYEIQTGGSGQIFLIIANTYGSNYIQVNTGDMNYDDGKWHHVLATYDGSSTTGGMRIYYDGVNQSLSGTGTISATIGNSVNFTIGSRSGTNSQYFTGDIDHVKVFDYDLTPAQAAYEYNRGGPTGWWKFDECQGTTAYDASGNGLNGTIAPSASGNTAVGDCYSGTSTHMWNNGVVGKYNSSLDFDDTDDYVLVANSSKLNVSDSRDFSLAAWIYRNGSTTNDTIMAKRNSVSTSDPGYILRLEDAADGHDILFSVSDGTDEYNVSGRTIFTTPGWYHIVAVYDDDSDANTTVYVNGVNDEDLFDGTLADIGSLDAVQLAIGAEPDGQNVFDGRIDDVRYYNYALTESQVRKVMNENSGARFGPAEGRP